MLLLEPKRNMDGSVNLEWWNSLSDKEQLKYNVWIYDIPNHPLNKSAQDKMQVTLVPEILDTSNLEEDNHTKDAFRPLTFDEYIGQERAKQRVLNYIIGCKEFNDQFPHIFLSAPAGCGKTVFANIISNMLGNNFIKCGAVELKSEQQLVDKIVECNGGSLFIDEFHKISKKLGTFLLPILEERLINGKKVKPFVLIVATTHKGNLSKDLSALVQRFLPIELENYAEHELIKIIKQFHLKTYSQIKIKEEIYNEIVNNCKYTPRIALRLFREYIYIKDLNKVKYNNQIIKNGITEVDIKVLKYLNEHNGCGKNSIAKYLNVEPSTYEFEIEPFLLFKQFIIVASKRKITNLGKEFLNEIKN